LRRSIFVSFVLLVFFAAAFLTTPITAPFVPPEDVVVPRLEFPVTLDGVITNDEWRDAVVLDVIFNFNDPGATNRSGRICLKHDCNLWICIQIEDPTENTMEWAAVFYDANEDGSTPGIGDDEKGMVHPDQVFDIAIIGGVPGWDNDTDLGGTLDIQGASGWALGTLTYEFVHPLDSGDSIGNDPTLQPGDSILAHFMVGDPEVGVEYYGYSPTIYNLIITPCPVGGEVLSPSPLELIAPYLLISAIIVAGTVGILYKKRFT